MPNPDGYYNTTLDTDIIYTKGVGPARGKILKKNGLNTVGDLIYHFPRRYLDRTNIKTINHLRIGDEAVILGRVDAFGIKPAKKRRFFQLTITDSTGSLNCVWFRGVSWISDKFQVGDAIAIFGKVEFYNGLKIIHPEFDLIDEDDPINTQRIIPLYPSNQELKSVGLDSRGLRRVIMNALSSMDIIEDFYNTNFIKQEGLYSHHNALEAIHNPSDKHNLDMGLYRLKFDELFFLQLLMALKKNHIKNKTGTKFIDRGPYVKAIYDSLSFELTNAQIRVLREIRTDLQDNKPMNRLIQGDVGSGKTIVAMLAASIVIGNNSQVAVMAPTEILAEQHYISFLEYCEKVNINCKILVGAHTDKEKTAIKENLKNGTIQLIVGTHALIQKNVEFQNLGMIIIDEQHRFGVEHRKMLIEKGINPEILAMTATPIPRTLAFAIHGDMDISIIDELPKNRLPIMTKVVEPGKMDEVYLFMKKQMDAGRQCFVVYPLIEESEKIDLQAAEVGYKKLKDNILKDYAIGYIHGKMKKDERDEQMGKMFNNEIQCLVSTTVIEVGVNIPNATIMIIENSERFGLTQLHQLRGRIGRGSEQSYCILVKHKSTQDGILRLNIMEKTNDGFKISDEDLKLRGPGEFFGTKQHGHLRSKLVNYAYDSKIIKHARDCAFNTVKLDPELNKNNHKGIKKQFLKNYKNMLEFVSIN